jgi:hypothetical protein
MEQRNVKTVQDVADKVLEASQFGWDSFTRLLILIFIIAGITLLFLYLYVHWKRKTSRPRTKDPHLSVLASGIPDILNIIEKMAEYQQETVYRIMGYISQERLGYISRRYIKGFINFCTINHSLDDVQQEFDGLIDDISREAVDHKTFKDYIRDCGLIVDVLQTVKEDNFSAYQLQKTMESQINSAVAEAIKESKKLSFVEVN